MKCIGTSKDTYGLGCRTEQTKRKLGLGIECGCYSSFLLNTPQGKARIKRLTVKVTKPRMDLEAATLDKKARTSLGALKKQTQLLFNSYIRMRDENLPCISSGIPYKEDFDAGHCFPVGSYEGLRYDFDNVHGQSIGDNRFNEGNHVDYLINLPKRIGLDRFKTLVAKAEAYKKNGYKFTKCELLEIQKEIRLKIKLWKLQESSF